MEAQRSTTLLSRRPVLLGMVHLAPLPGAPAAASARAGAREPAWRTRAVEDATVLARAGFDGVLVENFGDAPFFKDRVPAETVAALAIACAAVRAAVPARVAVGVNVLRNDAASALAVAAAAGLDLVRINVLAGAAVTDQGVVEGCAAEVLRLRARLCPNVAILADLRVKHARPLVDRPLADEARELVGRAGADAVIVSGTATGTDVDPEELRAARAALGAHPLLVGSGVTAKNVRALLESADGVIVGTSIKRGGRTTARVDAARAKAFVRAAR